MFSKKELAFINLAYFNICRIIQEENLLEIQSINTKDYWIIKKINFFEGKYPIILYHRHSDQKYYHKHWQYYKVKQCVKAIKNHDSYKMNKLISI